MPHYRGQRRVAGVLLNSLRFGKGIAICCNDKGIVGALRNKYCINYNLSKSRNIN